MPLTTNGKIDITSLIRSGEAGRTLPGEFFAPREGFEQAIAGIWCDVLDIQKVSADANFFDLGGNSILMVHVRNKLRELIDRELTMVDMFTFTSIRSLAEHLLTGDDGLPAVDMQTDIDIRRESRRRRKRDRKTQRVNI
jgi:hypothetical protein